MLSSNNALSLAFSDLKAAFKGKPKQSKEVALLQQVTQDEYYGKPPLHNARELAKLYESNQWVHSIVSKISESVARQRWYLEDSEGNRIDKHPALDFIKAGCRGLRGRKAFRAHSIMREVHGEVFWIIGRNTQGVPVAWAPIPSHWVLDTPGKTHNKFRIQPRAGAPFEVGPEDVIHFREPNPLDPYGRGTSRANAVRLELDSDAAAATFVNSYFANRARPDYILSGTVDAPLADGDIERLHETVREKFRGASRAGRPLITANELKLTTLTSGLRDNQMSEVRELSKANIFEAWGVPPEIFGRLDSSNKATIDNADALFARFTIDPRLADIEDDLQPFIEENFDLGGLELRYETPIKEDKAFALEAVKVRSTAFTDNEVRALANHKAVDGKDEFPEVPEPLAADDGDDEPDDTHPKGRKPKPKDDKALVIEGTVQKGLTFDDVVTVSGAHEDPQVRAEVTRLFDEIYAALVSKFGVELLELLEAEVEFQTYGAVAEFVAREVPALVGQIDLTTRKELLAALTEGVAASEAVEALIKRVQDVFAEAAKIRASLISDTIATKIAGFASQTAAKQAGMQRKKWLSSRDHVVRESHRALDKQVQPIDMPFVSPTGAQAMHPGAFGSAKEDANCRCAMRPLLEGEKAAALSDEEYDTRYEALRAGMAKKLKSAVKKVFAGQEAVAIAELKRIGEFRR
jgi:HK97 family phage portal protein